MDDEGGAPEASEEKQEPTLLEIVRDLVLLGHRWAAGLLCQAGAISVDEARRMSGLKPFSEGQRERILQLLRWSRDTGVIVSIAWHDLWYEKDN